MYEDGNLITSAIVSRIKAIGEQSAVARLQTAELRLLLATDRPRAGIDGRERR